MCILILFNCTISFIFGSGMTINQDFFFGDGEINQIPFDYDNLNNMDTSQDWTLPNEAFEPRHDILHRSAIPPQEFSSKCSPREIQDAGMFYCRLIFVLKGIILL